MGARGALSLEKLLDQVRERFDSCLSQRRCLHSEAANEGVEPFNPSPLIGRQQGIKDLFRRQSLCPLLHNQRAGTRDLQGCPAPRQL